MIDIPSHIIEACKKIKLIFFDIDGTLLNASGQWSDSIPRVLERLHKQGIKLAIASGRPSFAAQFIFDTLPILDAGVFCTGAEIYSPREKKSITTHFLATERVAALYEHAKAEGIYTEFYTEQAFFVPEFTEVTRIHAEHLRVQPFVMPSATVFSEYSGFTKLLLGNDERVAPERLEKLAGAFPDMEFAFANFLACPGWRFASVISTKASKHSAFLQLLDYHKISAEEVAAFGDSHSDEVFIELAGLGVAMGNATSEVLKQNADFVTDSVEQNGVESVLDYIGRY